MRRTSWRIALPIIILLSAASVYAQDDERQEFKMPCQQVIKLGLDKFSEAYGEQTQEYSTAGQKVAFEYFVNCKRPANEALAAKLLSEERRQQIATAREEFNKFGNALWTLKYWEEGGGTMWGLISVGAYAEREQFMESLIKTLAASERKSPRSRRSVNASLMRIQRLLASHARKPFTEYGEPDDIAQSKQSYQEAMQEARDALTKLRELLGSMPDAAAGRLAAKMAGEAKHAFAESL